MSVAATSIFDPDRRLGLPMRWYAVVLVTAAIAIAYFDRQTLARRHRRHPAVDPHLQPAIRVTPDLVPARLRRPLRSGRTPPRSPRNTPRLSPHHALVVDRLRPPRASRQASASCSRHASCLAWARAEHSLPQSASSRNGSLPSRTLHRRRYHQRRYRHRLRTRPAAHRLRHSTFRMALRLYRSQRCRPRLGRLVGRSPTARTRPTSLRIPSTHAYSVSTSPFWRSSPSVASRSLVFAKFMSDSAWYFLLFWLPKYLYDARGFDIKHVSYYAWIPYAASGLGSLPRRPLLHSPAARGCNPRPRSQDRSRPLRTLHARRHACSARARSGLRSCCSASPSSASSPGPASS